MKAAILLKNILATIEKLNTLEFEHRAEEVFGSEEMGATTDLNEKKSELEVIENLAKEVNKLSDLFKTLHAEKEELKRRIKCTEELANLGSWVLDYETKKMIWSEEAFKIFGKPYDEREVTFDTFLNVIHPNDRMNVNNICQNALPPKSDILEVEHRIVPDASQKVKYVLEKCKHQRNEIGDIVRSVGFVKDITQKKQNEVAFHANLNELNSYKYALDKSSIVAITDQKGVITYVNERFCEISKYSREELLGKDHSIVNSKHHTKAFFKNLWQTIAKGNVWKGEIKNKAKDGSYYWVKTSIVPFLNEQGKPYQYLSIRYDITDKKKAEESLIESHHLLEKTVEKRTAELVEVIANLTKSEELLKKSEAFNRDVLNSLTSHISVINERGEIVAVNDAWNKFAISNGDIELGGTGVGANYFEVCEKAIKEGDSSIEKALTGMKDVLEDRVELFQIEYPCHSPQQQRWFSMRAVKFESSERMIVVSHTDITARKLVEQKIVFHANLLAAVEQSVIATDIKGNIIFWNHESEKIYGWKEDEVLGKNIVEVLASSQSIDQGNEVMDVLGKGSSWCGEFLVKSKDLKEFLVYVSTSLITGDDGELIGIIGVSFDVTERVLAEKKILESEIKLRAIYESEPSCIKILDREGRLLEMNPAGLSMIEADEFNKVRNCSVFEVISEEYHAAYLDFIKKVFEGERAKITIQIIGLKGTLRWMENNAVPMKDNQGNIVSMLVVSHDFTDRVNHLMAIENQNVKLKEIAWMQSHVVRAPLARMMGIVHVLQEEDLNTHDFKIWVNHFVESSTELDNIIREISNKSIGLNNELGI